MKKKRITISINDYAYNQLIAICNETKETKSHIITEILNRTLANREKKKHYIEIKQIEKIQIKVKKND